ncbi:MAG: acetate--CoA ligase family protein [Desulfobacterales bacterium]
MNILNKALSENRFILTEYEAKKVLAEYGIPVSKEILVDSETALMDAVRNIGFPVVIKGCDPKFVHKSEKDLIRTDIRYEKEAVAAFHDIRACMAGAADKVLVQEMIMGKRELVAGSSGTASSTASVMFGISGIFTEIFNDVSFRIAPINKQDALEMMEEIRGKRILDAVRGLESVDRDQLCDILVRIGQIGVENEMIQEIDINPIIISKGRCIAVDAMIVLKSL